MALPCCLLLLGIVLLVTNALRIPDLEEDTADPAPDAGCSRIALDTFSLFQKELTVERERKADLDAPEDESFQEFEQRVKSHHGSHGRGRPQRKSHGKPKPNDVLRVSAPNEDEREDREGSEGDLWWSDEPLKAASVDPQKKSKLDEKRQEPQKDPLDKEALRSNSASGPAGMAPGVEPASGPGGMAPGVEPAEAALPFDIDAMREEHQGIMGGSGPAPTQGDADFDLEKTEVSDFDMDMLKDYVQEADVTQDDITDMAAAEAKKAEAKSIIRGAEQDLMDSTNAKPPPLPHGAKSSAVEETKI